MLALASGACTTGSGNPTAPAATTLSATGLIIAANGTGPESVTSFTLQTDDGRTLNFVVGTLDVSNGGLPAPHLREHMAGSTRTTVWYVVQDGQNVAVKYIDADE